MATELKPLLLISGGPSTKALWPDLAERYDLVFLYTAAGQEAAGNGLPAAPLAAVVDPDLQERIENTTVLMTAQVVANLPAISQRFGLAYGHDAPAQLNGRLGTWFAGYSHHILLGTISILAQLEKLAASGRRIAGCVTHEDVAPDTRAMVTWCNAHGIPTIHVPHAPCHLTADGPDVHKETRAQWIAASGPQVAEFYKRCGFPADHVEITGGPQWDDLYSGAIPGKAEARTVLGIGDRTGPVLCYMTTWGQTTSLRSGFDAEFEQGWQAVLAAAQKLGAYLMVLVHWNDQRGDIEDAYAKEMDAAGVDGLVTRSHKSYIVTAADVLIAQGPSNMCIDAAITGTPSVYLQTEGFDYATPLPHRAAVGGLMGAIQDALDGGTAGLGAFVAEYNAAQPHGDAADRVVAMVERLCP